MKKTISKLTLTIFLINNISFSQIPKSLEKEIKRDIQLYGSNYVEGKKYYINSQYMNQKPPYEQSFDEKNNNTTVSTYDKKTFKVLGEWELIDPKKQHIYYHVGHCPAIYNKENFILELYANNELGYKWKKQSSNEILEKVKLKFEKSVVEYSRGYTLYKHDSVNNYYLYKKKNLLHLDKNINDVYYLLGVKNKKVYRFALSNFNENEYENIEDFLIETYIKNYL